MRKRLLLFSAMFAVSWIGAAAQTVDSNPAHAPSVFLGNDRPKNKKDKAPTYRSVTGKAVDDSGQPLEKALVTITDMKSNDKWTFITKKDGRYSFDGLSFDVDYTLEARYKDSSSAPAKISQYDHMPKAVRILEVTSPHAPSTEAKDTPK